MCCHKLQLEFICIILGFSKFSAIIRYCCHDESLELSRACFCNAVAISNFTLPFGSSLYFPLVPVFKKKKKPMEKYNHHPNSEKKRFVLRYVETVQTFICLRVEMFCLEEGDGWCLPHLLGS